MAHKKNITMDSEKVLLFAMARAMGPYIAQLPGAFDTTAPVVNDVATLQRPEFKGWKYRYAYRRCGEFGEPDSWLRDAVTGAAYCANGHDPYPMADEKMTLDLLNVVIGVISAQMYKSLARDGNNRVLPGIERINQMSVAEVRGFGAFYISRRFRQRWKNPKNRKYYKGGWSAGIGFRPGKESKWAHGDSCNCGGD